MQAFRIDRVPIVHYEELDDGWLKVVASFSRVGPLVYLDEHGQPIEEYLTAEELYDEESLATAAQSPVILGHPEEGMLTPQIWKHYAIGSSAPQVIPRPKDQLVDAIYLVNDAEGIRQVKTGEAVEVSMGYRTIPILNADGRIYQTKRRYNHHGIVKRGRAGPRVKLRSDALQRFDIKSFAIEKTGLPTEKTDMPKIKGVEVPQLVFDEYTAVKNECDQLKTDSVQLKTDSASLTTVTAERDMYKAKVDEQKKELDSRLDVSEVAKVAAARLDAFTKARPYLKDVKFDASVEAIEWKRQAIAAARPSIKLDGQNGDYINAAFDVLEAVGISNPGQQTKTMLDSAAAGGDRSGSALEHNDSDWDAQLRADEEAINKSYEQVEAAK
ncbi:MAG: DUF2213 domain-containing protein [Cyanobacteria bacterium J06634_6]